MQEKPRHCQGCNEGSSPIYKFELILESEGWATTKRTIWLCADCQYTLAFAEAPLYQD